MQAPAISPVYAPLFNWIPQIFSQRIPFPDFSYVRRVAGLESWAEVYNEWDRNPSVFIDELLAGKISQVRVESYLSKKNEAEVGAFLGQFFARVTSGEIDFEQVLRGSALMLLNGKVDECSSKILDFKKGYATEIDDIVKPSNKMYRTKVMVNFFPNLIDTFLKAFNLLDTGKRPESIWDYNAMITIYLTVLYIPTALLSIAFHFTASPVYAAMIAGGLTVGFAAALYAYLAWFRPIPHDFPNCENVRDIATLFFADRRAPIEEIVRAIEAGQNVMIVGETGCGKSALALQVGKLLKNKTMQVLSDNVFENGYLTPVPKLQLDFGEAQKNPKKIVFFIDEFDRIISESKTDDKENLVKYLQSQMSLGQFQILAVCETNNYKGKIQPLSQLDGRFKKIALTSPSEAELAEILASYYHTHAEDVDCRQSLSVIVKHVIDETNKHKFKMRCRAQPAVAMTVWRYALERLKQFDHLVYKGKKTQDLITEERKIRSFFPSLTDEEKVIATQNLNQNALLKQAAESEDEKMRMSMQKIKKLCLLRIVSRKQLEVETTAFVKGDIACMRRWVYLTQLEKTLEKAIIEEEKILPSGITIRLNTDFIDAIIAECTPVTEQESARESDQ